MLSFFLGGPRCLVVGQWMLIACFGGPVMEWLYLLGVVLSTLAAVLAWLAKLKWSKEFSDAKNAALQAKDAALEAKDAHLHALEMQLDSLRQLDSPKIREYFLSTKAHLEEYNDTLKMQLEQLRRKADSRVGEARKQAAAAEAKYAETMERLKLTEMERENVTRAMVQMKESERAVTVEAILHEIAQPTFSALTCMELLRERDHVYHQVRGTDPVDFYLKKNIEVNLRLLTFHAQGARIVSGDASIYSPSACNLLDDVVYPVVNLMRFCIYDRHLKHTGGAIETPAIVDADLEKLQGEKPTIKAVYADVTYEIRYDKACANVQLFAEKYRLQQVFYNLLNNALKYKGQNRDYRVSIDYVADWPIPVQGRNASSLYHVIDVSDEGAGIDPNEREAIFELGRRGRRAREISRLPGTALGLTICRQVLRDMGGDIYVAGYRAPTTFRLLIPKECGVSDWPNKTPDLQARTRALLDPIIGGALDA